MASEWDPGPEELVDSIPSTKAGRDPFTALSTGPMDAAITENEVHWPDFLRGRQWSLNWKLFGTWAKFHSRISVVLMAEISGRQIWDPGGDVLEFPEGWEIWGKESRAVWKSVEKESGKLAGWQAFVF